jgi:FtsH-binding integral membrane protein
VQQSAGFPGVQQSAGFPGVQQSAGFPGAQSHAPGVPGAQQSAGYASAQAHAGQQHAHGHALPGAASNVHGVGGFAGGGADSSSEPAGSRGSLRDRANATEGVSDRTRFIRLTYVHLLGAILVFAGLEYLLMTNAFLIEKVSAPFVTFAIGGRWNWGIVLAAFMAVSWVADYWASHTTSRSLQYVGLGFYVVAEAVIFVPLLAIVQWKTAAIIARGGGDPNIIRDAAFTTLAIFGALTASVFVTKKDFSFLRTGLMMASAAAMMLVILSLVFGFNLGIVFSIAMVLLAAGYILFQTSQILAHYDPRNHVAAALALFSSVALMFWYVIRIFMRMRE